MRLVGLYCLLCGCWLAIAFGLIVLVIALGLGLLRCLGFCCRCLGSCWVLWFWDCGFGLASVCVVGVCFGFDYLVWTSGLVLCGCSAWFVSCGCKLVVS